MVIKRIIEKYREKADNRTVYGELELMQGKIELKIELSERTGVR